MWGEQRVGQRNRVWPTLFMPWETGMRGIPPPHGGEVAGLATVMRPPAWEGSEVFVAVPFRPRLVQRCRSHLV